MVTLIQFICVILMYLYVSIGSMVSGSASTQSELKNEYKDYLNEKNRIQCDAITVSHTNTADELVSQLAGKGRAFEDIEGAVKDFKEKYIGKMIKVSGRICKIDYAERTVIFENNIDCLWAAFNVRAIVDDPTLYKNGEIVSVVGRCLGVNCLGSLYIDCGQIEQDIPSDSVEAIVTVAKRYDEAMTVQHMIDIYNTYGDGNILHSYTNGKVIQLTGYVVSTSVDRVTLASSKRPGVSESRIHIMYPGAKFRFAEGEEVSINATYQKADNILKNLFFEVAN